MGLEEEIKILKDRLDKLENERKDDFKLDERVYIDDIITRSYRFHKTALDEFNKVIKTDRLKIYNVQDLISQALWEFCKRYEDLD